MSLINILTNYNPCLSRPATGTYESANAFKIDSAFISDISMDHANRELVNATSAMAHGLGLFMTEPKPAIIILDV